MDQSLPSLAPPPLSVHRCRFVDFTPSPITALAFPPSPLPRLSGKRTGKDRERETKDNFGTLAVGHANGNIELYEWTAEEGRVQAPQGWQPVKTLVGPCLSKIDSMAFVLRYPDAMSPDASPTWSELRLFSSGGGSELVEWDLQKGCIKRTISSQGGAIWCIAANPASSLLALGCEDGSVRLLSLTADTLEHHRRFDRVKCRVLSIAWGPPVPSQPRRNKPSRGAEDDSDSDDDEEDWSDSWLVTGGSDSSMRKWDVASGRVLDRMSTDKIRGERTLVWAVSVLGDGTIISGDSLGTVKFWDHITCTQLHSFTAHGADVLCMTVGPDGTSVYTSGVDQKVIQFSYVTTTSGSSAPAISSASGRWTQSTSRRMHSHDVRALAMWPPYAPLPPAHKRKARTVAPILVSGGLDMSVVLTPALAAKATSSAAAPCMVNPIANGVVMTFEDSYYRRIGYSAKICFSRQARLVASMHESGVTIWRVLKTPTLDDIVQAVDNDQPEPKGGWEKALDMELNVRTNLIAIALSDNGRWLVASDMYESRLFQLTTTPNGTIKPKRVRSFASVLQAHLSSNGKSKAPTSTGATSFTFTPDSSKLMMATATQPRILYMDLSTEEPSVLRRFDQHLERSRRVAGRIQRGVSKEAGIDEPEESNSSAGSELSSVVRLAVSPDGQWAASADDSGRINVYNLDSLQYHTTLPSLPLSPSTLSFIPNAPHTLLATLPNNTIHAFDVENGDVPSWSKELNARLPQNFTGAFDPVLGVLFDPVASCVQTNGVAPEDTAPSSKDALFWGSTWVCRIKLDWEGSWRGPRKRRKSTSGPRPGVHTVGQDGQHLKMVTQYRPILGADFFGPGELVVVERPLVDVLSKLPPAYFKPKYGAT
ncbi:WD40 repeat-like protein [Coniophora puteana RWD-64-598 SS2]|uniref:WD40 repeat-like protein n=1 Tax=Coniophora puteana (strain RWD-64-598) TaxID=741705 RepID=A0A5M3N624_CONPW|nr:WD40 repeat-like protein [Coniophora puteana RWD-64-598 SS2]EIW86524.1 WD40 repeat-like protein [Coniophora puteana RWD-64-598 SS2]